LFLPDLGGGGAERIMLSLAKGFGDRGMSVDLVLARAEGPYLDHVPEGARLVDLGAQGRFRTSLGLALKSLTGLIRYLRRIRPDCLLSSLTRANLVAVVARHVCGAGTRLVLREANTALNIGSPATRFLMRRLYGRADYVIAVSTGVAEDLVKVVGVPADSVRIIHNPLDIENLQRLASLEPDHPWLTQSEPPVILGVGRLAPQKDFVTLVRAFAEVRRARPVRLVILGEGEQRAALQSLIRSLGLENDVDMPGFARNPYAFMKHARLFVLSSRWEGFPNVLAEAMAVGVSVVSTDCRSGPAEILAGGTYGRLVPVGSPTELAAAMLDALNAPAERSKMVSRAKNFSLDTVVDDYIGVLTPGYNPDST
jgi:glycosyltransferase involved in cell wall biosynthesis